MSYLAQDIAAFLIANDICSALAEDVFCDKMPSAPDKCVVIFEYDGMAEVPWELDATHRSIQLACRAPSASEAKATATRIHNLIKSSLDETGRIDFNGRFTQTSLRQTPFKLNEDDNARVVYGFNLGITTSDDT